MATLNGNCGLAPILYVLGMAEFREKLEAFWKAIRTKNKVAPSQDVSLNLTGTSPDHFEAEPDPVAHDVDDLPDVCPPPSTPEPHHALPQPTSDLSDIIDILNDLSDPPDDVLPVCPPNTPENMPDIHNIPDYFGEALMKMMK